MSQLYRISDEGLLNRNNEISFKFNGTKYTGYEGDTLASAVIVIVPRPNVNLLGSGTSVIESAEIAGLPILIVSVFFYYINSYITSYL